MPVWRFMPIFEFFCTHCDHGFESLMKPRDPIECPKCKTREVDKVPSVVGGHIWKCSSDGAMPKSKK